jgi:hypothetical protein
MQSRHKGLFCSQKCYMESDQFKNMIRGSRNRFNDNELLEELRTFVIKHHRAPRCVEIPQDQTISKRFGSWNRAKEMVGVNQLLAEMK